MPSRTADQPDRALIRVICADDYPDFARMLRATINRERGMRCIHCAFDARDVIHCLDRTAAAHAEAQSPLVVVLDLDMPGMDTLQALREISRRWPEIRVLVCSGYDDDSTVEKVTRAGARGLVPKLRPEQIVAAIRKVAEADDPAQRS